AEVDRGQANFSWSWGRCLGEMDLAPLHLPPWGPAQMQFDDCMGRLGGGLINTAHFGPAMRVGTLVRRIFRLRDRSFSRGVSLRTRSITMHGPALIVAPEDARQRAAARRENIFEMT